MCVCVCVHAHTCVFTYVRAHVFVAIGWELVNESIQYLILCVALGWLAGLVCIHLNSCVA